MQTGHITQKYDIKRNTLRFYIRKGLLTPKLSNGHYDWSDQDCQDLENILGLRQLGLSIKAIARIKHLHEQHCGTKEQLVENRQVLLDEIAERREQIQQLERQVESMTELLGQVEEKLAIIS